MPKLIVPAGESGRKLGRFLQSTLPGVRAADVFKLFRKRKVTLNGKRVKPDAVVQAGDEVWVRMPTEENASMSGNGRVPPELARHWAPEILHREAGFVVVNKPAGLPVHGGAGHGGDSVVDAVQAWLDAQSEGEQAPQARLVHRLDKLTSGVLLLSLDFATNEHFLRAWRRHEVGKTYWALVAGNPRSAGEIDAPVVRRDAPHAGGRKVHAVAGRGSPAGQRARSRYHTLARGEGVALLEVVIETGRTHQIRAHLLAANLPIAGDPMYGEAQVNRDCAARCGLRRPFLHAARLEVPRPDGGRMTFRAPLPPDLAACLRAYQVHWPSRSRNQAATKGV